MITRLPTSLQHGMSPVLLGICCASKRAQPRLTSAIFVCVILAGSLMLPYKSNATAHLAHGFEIGKRQLTLLLLQPLMVHGMVLSFAWATMALDTTVTAVHEEGTCRSSQQPQSQQSMPPPP